MAENSNIEWTDHTFNAIVGCTKVSPGCEFCYAERDMDLRLGRASWGPRGTRTMTSDANWKAPLRWNQKAGELGVRYKVFTASLSDVFEDWQGPIVDHNGKMVAKWPDGTLVSSDDSVPPRIPGGVQSHWITMDDVRRRLFKLIDATTNLDWLMLTKRPENIEKMWPYAGVVDSRPSVGVGYYRPNVWLGTSVENQKYADERIPELLKCRDLSPVLFLSCEPLLGAVNLLYPESLYPGGPATCCSGFECGCMGLPIDPPALGSNFGGIDWVIAGGESGPHARPSHPSWFRSIRDQCQSANVPFHFKQWGEWLPIDHASPEHDGAIESGVWRGEKNDPNDLPMLTLRVGKKRAGRVLDDRTHDGFPVVKSVH